MYTEKYVLLKRRFTNELNMGLLFGAWKDWEETHWLSSKENAPGVTFSKVMFGGARGIMVIVIGNGHGDTSSNPGQDW